MKQKTENSRHKKAQPQKDPVKLKTGKQKEEPQHFRGQRHFTRLSL